MRACEKGGWVRRAGWALCWGWLWLGAGCVAPGVGGDPGERAQAMAAAQVPGFLTGPIGVVLTNADDFSARVTLSRVAGGVELLSGNLFQQSGRFLFVSKSDELHVNPRWAGAFRFLWNVHTGSGFVICESLRGYLPVSAAAGYEMTAPGAPVGLPSHERIGDQDCVLEEIVVRAGWGADVPMKVWRAPELGRLPLRIVPHGGPDQVQLSDANLDALNPDLFLLPRDYARYSSVESMVRRLTRKPPVMPYTSGGR